ncbi:transforming growth factor beta activator LRRC32 [Ahaetulla prasina]|uniref:transforming growth factor beta activator LRRC32 n=1 Tax=Ahaetulla prasina TaxID=499056 RepID=UPI00264784F6|nr:transforming growth factor beta activator LRRC32 [Ahaetulla prasina]XP_058041960.1 transforming growth factor beta activator LRRC32 [Ahaetulla prasina]XP_058041961.1 transforming growth factor beta activator LRRC32 [Ahaetulla prasina]XP_058041963.1 transforming growth factor beta activator LRRC32 [Ahaetulla prasina]XP_058041964.1 transforming growth factor beta activator LRRC32 [Ahaetulla prasina]
MKFYLLLFFWAVLNGGISTYRPLALAPCKMRNLEAFCQNVDLHQVPPELRPDVSKIDASGNKIQNVTETPLTFYASLRHLDLSSNLIGFVQPGVFAEMKNLQDVNLANNQLYLLAQEDLWVGLLPQVRRLDLSRNSLYNGMAEHFIHQAPSLRHLSLAENSIIHISQNMFQGTPELVEVNLHNNMIMEIEGGAFESLTYLSKLNLSMNSLTCIVEFNLRQLEVLDLHRNSIESFHSTQSEEEEEDFNLIWLDLSENKLLRFPILPQRNKLAYLNLTNNLMQFVMVDFHSNVDYQWEDWPQYPNNSLPPYLPALLSLDLSYNEIQSIPSQFFDSMLSLQFLNLSKNCLQTFETSNELASLSILDLSCNSLKNLKLDTKTLSGLREFHLQDNHLQELRPDIFQGLPHLQWLDLRNNKVHLCDSHSGSGRHRLSAKVPHGCVSFVRVPELQYLYLSANHLKNLPMYNFFGTKLRVLDVSMNWGLQIEAKSLVGLEFSLEYLDLHGNGLTTLNVDFSLFPHLRYLNLSYNQLSWLPPWSEDCCVLEVLDLHNNSFNSLKNSQIPALEKNLRNLYLVGNPLSCCGNIWLSQMIHKAVVEIPDLDLVKCQFARSLGFEEEEVHVSHVKPEDCEREDLKKISVLIFLAVLLVLSLIVIGVGLVCCYRRHLFGRHYKV